MEDIKVIAENLFTFISEDFFGGIVDFIKNLFEGLENLSSGTEGSSDEE